MNKYRFQSLNFEIKEISKLKPFLEYDLRFLFQFYVK